MYALSLEALKYITQILNDLMREIDNTIIVGDVNTPVTSVDRSDKIRKHRS